jgi:hypothetical protein
MDAVSIQGESYEQWRERTAPQRPAQARTSPRWDLAVIVLLGVFFVWVGGRSGWVGLALVAVMAAEQVIRFVLARRADQPVASAHQPIWLRGATLLVTLLVSGALVSLMGGAAWGLPPLLVLFDLQDRSSFLRWAFDRLRGVSSRRRPT